jgi:hypothetical protein
MKKRTMVMIGLLLGVTLYSAGRFPVQSRPPAPAAVSAINQSVLLKTTDLAVWQALPTEKIFPDQALPQESSAAVEIFAAQGEYEPFQIILRPQRAVPKISLVLSDFSSDENGYRLAQENLEIRQVDYVNITEPTDWNSYSGPVPDPLPDYEPLFNPLPQRNYPYWITAFIPSETPAGNYHGTLEIVSTPGETLVIPINLHVWDFELPKESHIRTSYGLSNWEVAWYHNLTDPAKQRAVLDLYYESYRQHRVSVFNPMANFPVAVSFPNLNWNIQNIVPDPLDPNAANKVLKIDDSSSSQCIGEGSALFIPVNRLAPYRFSWKAYTPGGHRYLVSVNQFDKNNQWLLNQNIDTEVAGEDQWTAGEILIPPERFAPETVAIKIVLYAVPWTPQCEQTGLTYFDDIAFGSLEKGPNLVANGNFDLAPADIELNVDFSEFDQAASRYLDEFGFNSFLFPLYGFGSGNCDGRMPGHILGYEQGSPEYEVLFGKYLTQAYNHIRERGWLDKAFAYWFDEPEFKDYAFVEQGMDLIHRYAPDLKRLLTEVVSPSLIGYVDLWVPHLEYYAADLAKQRQLQGEEMWWYICTVPMSPYPNNFIDHVGIEPRIFFWISWDYQVQGTLYWNTTYWTNETRYQPGELQNPWIDPMSYGSSFDNQVVAKWGNGDGRLLYPPNRALDSREYLEGPVPSIRWEIIREGIEDYEYFYKLRELAQRLEVEKIYPDLLMQAQSLLNLPASIVESRTAFTRDSAKLYDYRYQLGSLIETIEKNIDIPYQPGCGGKTR